MRVSESRGIAVKAAGKTGQSKNPTELLVDAWGRKNREIVVSHAHSDHARLTQTNTYYATPETAALVKCPKNAEIRLKRLGQRFRVNGFDVTLHNSGHIVGGSQLLVENGSTLAITADFKLQKTLLTEPAEILRADTLLIESTFGKPQFVFPPRERVYEDLMHWCHAQKRAGKLVVLGGYATGKAQELTRFCNDFLDEAPLVYETVFTQNEALKKAGVNVGDYVKLQHNLGDGDVVILPPTLLTEHMVATLQHFSGRKIACALATGWPRPSRHCKSFPLSDHADFRQLLDYVKQSEPKLVLTHHGFAAELARAVTRRLNTPARPLAGTGQRTVLEFAD